jgi:hypothetical protein
MKAIPKKKPCAAAALSSHWNTNPLNARSPRLRRKQCCRAMYDDARSKQSSAVAASVSGGADGTHSILHVGSFEDPASTCLAND